LRTSPASRVFRPHILCFQIPIPPGTRRKDWRFSFLDSPLPQFTSPPQSATIVFSSCGDLQVVQMTFPPLGWYYLSSVSSLSKLFLLFTRKRSPFALHQINKAQPLPPLEFLLLAPAPHCSSFHDPPSQPGFQWNMSTRRLLVLSKLALSFLLFPFPGCHIGLTPRYLFF